MSAAKSESGRAAEPPVVDHAADFAERFGAENVAAIIAAAHSHDNGLHDNPGSDEFRWALLIGLGFECMSKFQYSHGITAPWRQVDDWMRARPEWFSEHDGDTDTVSLFCGVYNEYVGQEALGDAQKAIKQLYESSIVGEYWTDESGLLVPEPIAAVPEPQSLRVAGTDEAA